MRCGRWLRAKSIAWWPFSASAQTVNPWEVNSSRSSWRIAALSPDYRDQLVRLPRGNRWLRMRWLATGIRGRYKLPDSLPVLHNPPDCVPRFTLIAFVSVRCSPASWLSHRKGVTVAKWILICRNCAAEFDHSQIGDVELARLLLPEKPIVPSGQVSVCPNCGFADVYQRIDLRCRHF